MKAFFALLAALAFLGFAQPTEASTFTDNLTGAAGTCLTADGAGWTATDNTCDATHGLQLDGSGNLNSVSAQAVITPSLGSADQSISWVFKTAAFQYACVRMTNASNAGACGAFDGSNQWFVFSTSGGSNTTLGSIVGGNTPVAGDTITLTVTGTVAQISLTHAGTTTVISGPGGTTTVNQTVQTAGLRTGGAQTGWLSGPVTAQSVSSAPTVVITDPIGCSQFTQQILPHDEGQTYKTCAFTGTYTGTAPTNIDIQLYQTDGTTVVQAWTTCNNSPTISGGAWSNCQVRIPAESFLMKAQARETNSTTTTSAVTANTFGVGEVMLAAGQSNAEHDIGQSATLNDATIGAAGATTFTSATVLANWNNGAMVGMSLTGPDFAAGTAVTANSGNTVTFSPATTGAGGSNRTVTIQLTPPAANALSFRWSGPAVYPVTDAFHTGEYDTGTVADAEGATTHVNLIGSNFAGGSGAMMLPYAVGSTSITCWMTAAQNSPNPAGNCWSSLSSGANRLALIGGDYNYTYYVGNETDAVNGMAGSTYLADLALIEGNFHTFRPNSAFLLSCVGRASTGGGGGTDATWNAIRQACFQYIDANASGYVAYGGDYLTLPHQDQYHLTPAGRVTFAKRHVQARLRYLGLASSGYGPKIASASWDGNITVTVTVAQEAGTALTSSGLSSSGSGITGFLVFGNGVAATIASTAFAQPNKIILTLSTRPSAPVTLSYLAGINPNVTNPVYDNMAPFGDSNGLPLQPSRGTNGLMVVSVPSAGISLFPLLGL